MSDTVRLPATNCRSLLSDDIVVMSRNALCTWGPEAEASRESAVMHAWPGSSSNAEACSCQTGCSCPCLHASGLCCCSP